MRSHNNGICALEKLKYSYWRFIKWEVARLLFFLPGWDYGHLHQILFYLYPLFQMSNFGFQGGLFLIYTSRHFLDTSVSWVWWSCDCISQNSTNRELQWPRGQQLTPKLGANMLPRLLQAGNWRSRNTWAELVLRDLALFWLMHLDAWTPWWYCWTFLRLHSSWGCFYPLGVPFHLH